MNANTNGASPARNCSSPSFRALLLTQFLGSLNENAHRVLITLLVVNTLVQQGGGIGHLVLVNILVFLPFIIFSPLAGYFSDRFSKSTVIRRAKLLELAVMGLTLVLLLRQDVLALIAAMFLSGCVSTLISPCKYGIIPELIPDSQLSRGNGQFQFWSFLAIIVGTALGGSLAGAFTDAAELPGLVLVAVATAGIIAAGSIEQTPAGDRRRQLTISPRGAVDALSEMSRRRPLYLSVLGIAYFWSVGALFQLNTVLFAKEYAGFSDVGSSLLLAALAFGIGLGGLAAGAASEGKVELGLVPLGTVGLSLACIVLSLAPTSYPLSFFILLLAGMSGGFFCIPLYAYVQEVTPADKRGSYWAAVNLLAFSGMILSSLVLMILVDFFRLNPKWIFLLVGAGTLVMAVYICSVLPAVLVRCINWIFVQSIYRLEVRGREFVPREGAAILVGNRCSVFDTALLAASIERPVLFLVPGMKRRSSGKRRRFRKGSFLARNDALRGLLNDFGLIAVSGAAPGEIDPLALRLARAALNRGELVCLLLDNGLQTIGEDVSGEELLAAITAGGPCRIVPTYLDQMWGGVVKKSPGGYSFRLPLLVPYPVTVHFGEAVTHRAGAPATVAETAPLIHNLAAGTFAGRADLFQQLERGFIAGCKRAPFARVAVDRRGRPLRRNELLTGALLLSEEISTRFGREPRLEIAVDSPGDLLLASAAVLISGRVPVYAAKEAAGRSGLPLICSTAAGAQAHGGAALALDDFERTVKGSLSKHLRAVLYYLAALLLPQHTIEQIFLETRSLDGAAAEFIGAGGARVSALSDREITAWCFLLYEQCRLEQRDVVVVDGEIRHQVALIVGIWLPLLCGLAVERDVGRTDTDSGVQPPLAGVYAEERKNSDARRKKWLFFPPANELNGSGLRTAAAISLAEPAMRAKLAPWISQEKGH